LERARHVGSNYWNGRARPGLSPRLRWRALVLAETQSRGAVPDAAAGSPWPRLGQPRPSHLSQFARAFPGFDAGDGETRLRATGALLCRGAGGLGRADSGAAGGRDRRVCRCRFTAGRNRDRFFARAVAAYAPPGDDRALGWTARE